MARIQTIQFLRTTKANLDTQVSADNLKVGEPYLITDMGVLAIGTGIDTYVTAEKSFNSVAKTSLTLDLSEAKYFFVTLSANTSFSLSNLVAGVWNFLVENTGGSAITIPVLQTANDYYNFADVEIASGKAVEISLASDGTKRVWLIGNTLTKGS